VSESGKDETPTGKIPLFPGAGEKGNSDLDNR